MNQWSQIGCALYLCVLSILDIRSRKLPVCLLEAGVGAAAGYQLFCREISLLSGLAGAAAGILFIGVSKWTEEALGYGDSILILSLGIYLGFWKQCFLLLLAFSLSAGFAFAALVFRHFKRKTAFPFVPFLSTAYLGMLLLEKL